jgi:hypothetical protein
MNGFPFTLSASDISAARLKYHVSISDIEFRYEPATRLQTLSKSRHREDAPASRLRTLETSLRRKDRAEGPADDAKHGGTFCGIAIEKFLITGCRFADERDQIALSIGLTHPAPARPSISIHVEPLLTSV